VEDKKPNISPISRMIDSVMRCVKCDAKMGECDCWTKCDIVGCSWSYEKGSKCRNPEHDISEINNDK